MFRKDTSIPQLVIITQVHDKMSHDMAIEILRLAKEMHKATIDEEKELTMFNLLIHDKDAADEVVTNKTMLFMRNNTPYYVEGKNTTASKLTSITKKLFIEQIMNYLDFEEFDDHEEVTIELIHNKTEELIVGIQYSRNGEPFIKRTKFLEALDNVLQAYMNGDFCA